MRNARAKAAELLAFLSAMLALGLMLGYAHRLDRERAEREALAAQAAAAPAVIDDSAYLERLAQERHVR